MRAQGKLIELELDADNCTSCPCGQVLKIRKKNRVGAAYAKKFKVLKKEHEWILDYTVGTNYRDEWLLKKEYRRYFLDKLEDTRGIKMGIDPIKARFSISNFILAWFSALLVLLGVVHLTLGGVGQDGFFTIREFYFLRSNTFEGLGRILIGLLLLNITVRGLKYKKRILTTAILFVISSVYSRSIVDESLTYFEIYFSSFTFILFISILFQNSNYTSVTKVK